MAQYPVDTEDGLYEAVNYLASGPAGLGQNFQGFNTSGTGYLNGNFRRPYVNTTPAALYVAPISLSTSEKLDPYTWKFTFASTQAAPPFTQGNNIEVTGVTPSDYDGLYSPIGVIACSTDYVICRTPGAFADPGPGTGGTVFYTSIGSDLSTDCNARVTVNGGTDRVFLTAQLDNTISYECSTTSELTYTVYLSRYAGFVNTDPVNPDFLFDFEEYVAEKTYTYTGLTGTGTLPLVETIFSTVIDEPNPNYYWYILEVYFERVSGDIEVTESEFGLRSLSAQVIKE